MNFVTSNFETVVLVNAIVRSVCGIAYSLHCE